MLHEIDLPAPDSLARLTQSIFEAFITIRPDQPECFVFLPDSDAGKVDAIEGRGLNHRVVNHVIKDDKVTWLKRIVEGIVAHEISRQAGHTTQAVRVLTGNRLLVSTQNARFVWHFECIRHVGSKRRIQNRHLDSLTV